MNRYLVAFHTKYFFLKQCAQGRYPKSIASFSEEKNTRFVRDILLPDLHCSVPYIFKDILPPKTILPSFIN